MKYVIIALLGSLLSAGLAAPAFSQEADAAPGQRLFQQRCGACHQITTPRNGVGPNLQGVVGRAAGTVEGFRYSAALRDSGITWTPEQLETFLSNPTAMVRGTRMTQRYNNAEERRTIIEFLGSQ
ncbi:cytochrome c (plasmid) [Ensifer sp. WSM1721]|uniref:c-type cytochrome n=1 Tax=Ensifer sp. WSM1721 TaxID=1041159 RepID=UPI00047B0205